jgi:hypothetical protein
VRALNIENRILGDSAPGAALAEASGVMVEPIDGKNAARRFSSTPQSNRISKPLKRRR